AVPGVSVYDLDYVRDKLKGLEVRLRSAVSVDDYVGVIRDVRGLERNVESIVVRASRTVSTDISNVVLFISSVFIVVLILLVLAIVSYKFKRI
ncbi:MAG: hypothetical protein ACP5IZ_11765, partial [Thermoprotei archaeon]